MEHPFIQELRERFQQASNPFIAEKQKAYMRNRFSYLGIIKPDVRMIYRELIKNHAILDENELRSLLLQLWSQDSREFQYVAMDLAYAKRRLCSPIILETFETMIRQKSWWDTVDEIATNLLGDLVYKHRQLITIMDQWIEDDELWIRRSALLYQLFWKNETDTQRLFRYCELTMHESDFFIRKAIGWVLRHYSKTNPQAVKEFIEIHRKQLSGLSIREGSKYLK